MARPRVRRKTLNPTSKVSRRNANKKAKKVVVRGNAVISAAWDKTQTLRQNYARLGLMSKLNGLTGGVEEVELFEPTEEGKKVSSTPELNTVDVEKLSSDMGYIVRDESGNIVDVVVGKRDPTDILDEDLPPAPAKTETVKALEAMAANGLKVERHQSNEEKIWAEKLIAKYGDNYAKMCRDRKLNPMQQTPAQIRRRIEKLQKNKDSK